MTGQRSGVSRMSQSEHKRLEVKPEGGGTTETIIWEMFGDQIVIEIAPDGVRVNGDLVKPFAKEEMQGVRQISE